MANLTRRSVLRTSLTLGAVGALARPHLAEAGATSATVWWTQGYAQEEDIAFKKIVAEYEKATGNTLDYSIVPYAPLRQKIVSAVTSGVVPDVFPNQPAEIIALFAWNDQLVDLTDVVETQREEYTDTALLTALCYNNVEKKRSFYGAPYTQGVLPNHIWRSLVEKAGYKMEDIPKTWDAYYDFFKEVQRKLRAQGERHVYGLGLNLGIGGDPHNVFAYFLIAYGGLWRNTGIEELFASPHPLDFDWRFDARTVAKLCELVGPRRVLALGAPSVARLICSSEPDRASPRGQGVAVALCECSRSGTGSNWHLELRG
jgi:multiple sugar transport system substrate-binding protein